MPFLVNGLLDRQRKTRLLQKPYSKVASVLNIRPALSCRLFIGTLEAREEGVAGNLVDFATY